MSNYDYESVKIGTVFRGLTLKEKGQPIGLRGKLLPSKWLMSCVCGADAWMSRSEMVSGKRMTCGKCKTARKVFREIKNKETAKEAVRDHLDIPGFKKVETRTHGDGSVWCIYRLASARSEVIHVR